MLTQEHRTHLLAQAEYWDDEQHQTYATAIRDALATIEEQAAELELLRPCAQVPLSPRAAGARAEWRRRFGGQQQKGVC